MANNNKMKQQTMKLIIRRKHVLTQQSKHRFDAVWVCE